MKRYIIVEGVKGTLVADPGSDAPGRYLAQCRCVSESSKLADHFTPTTVAVEDCGFIRKVVGQGGVKQVGGPIFAVDVAAAMVAFEKEI